MKNTYLGIACCLLMLGGCSHLAVSDGSLDYQQSELLQPLQLPQDLKTRAFVPLYKLPQKQRQNTLALTNEKGNRYDMPLPPSIEKTNN